MFVVNLHETKLRTNYSFCFIITFSWTSLALRFLNFMYYSCKIEYCEVRWLLHQRTPNDDVHHVQPFGTQRQIRVARIAISEVFASHWTPACWCQQGRFGHLEGWPPVTAEGKRHHVSSYEHSVWSAVGWSCRLGRSIKNRQMGGSVASSELVWYVSEIGYNYVLLICALKTKITDSIARIWFSYAVQQPSLSVGWQECNASTKISLD